MIGIYLSGTGNSEHCIKKLLFYLDKTAQAVPMEQKDAGHLLLHHDFIIFAYPVHFSNIPVMVRDFIKSHQNLWKHKKVLCVATMGLFSGDGAGCAARLLKKYGAKIVGGLHIHMPDSVCDVKLLKGSPEQNLKIIQAADRKIEKCAEGIRNGIYPRDGLFFYDRIAGLLGQRLWYYRKTKNYSDKLKISNACTGCGLCTRVCPMENLTLENGKAAAGKHCTMCYRCISLCPAKAITLLGRTVIEQYRYGRYVKKKDDKNLCLSGDISKSNLQKESFTVIGKEGAATDGSDFIQKLWEDANSHFGEVAHLAKKDENGNILGIWGAMSDFSRSFQPWEGFNQGLYLAGVECEDDSEAPDGWTKWVIPGYEYIYVERKNEDTFSEVIKYLEDHDISLAGAVHDFTCPQTGKGYMFFPIRKL